MKKPEEKAAWKVLSSAYLFRKPWLTIRSECVELPNGNQIPEYFLFEYPEWVNVIARTADGRFVFVRQYRHGLRKVSFELPAGVCEKTDKSPLEAAKRELLEETGFGGGNWAAFMTLSANPTTQTNLTHIFLAENVVPTCKQELDPGESLTVHLLKKEEILDLLQKDLIVQALMAAPLWKYFYQNPMD